MIERLGSREVYRNRWMSVREDRIRLGDGTESVFGVVEKADFALVIPRDDDGGLWLVEQYRYPVDRRGWEFPMGSWGQGETGSREALAAAELQQETGLRASQLRHLGHLYQAYGYATQGFDVYLATGLEQGAPDREQTEQDMVHRKVSPAEFAAMVRDGRIVDAPTIAAYGLLGIVED